MGVCVFVAACAFLVEASIVEEVLGRFGNVGSQGSDEVGLVLKGKAVVVAVLSAEGAEVASSDCLATG